MDKAGESLVVQENLPNPIVMQNKIEHYLSSNIAEWRNFWQTYDIFLI
jgi:hypothetical protein